MRIKFNGGLGAYLCDRCAKIVYTNSNLPEEWKDKSVEELQKMSLICEDCKYDNMTLKEFYDSAISRGCTDNTILSVECCRLYGFGKLTMFVEKDTFVVDPDITDKPDFMKGMTLKEFCDECRKFGCEDGTVVRVFYCNLSAFDVREVEWLDNEKKELVICID